jgi:putative chitinase
MQLTADQFAAATGCGRGVALTWAAPVADACALYEINTPARLSAFLAQVGHESAGFTRTVENLNYSADGLLNTWPNRFDQATAARCARQPEAIAAIAYDGRMGNSQPGDGFLFRGRGLLQVTGRANYEAVTELLRERMSNAPDLCELPQTLAEPKWAALSAAAFWVDHGLNELADVGAFDKITLRVNGGNNGAPDRRARYEKAKRALA